MSGKAAGRDPLGSLEAAPPASRDLKVPSGRFLRKWPLAPPESQEVRTCCCGRLEAATGGGPETADCLICLLSQTRPSPPPESSGLQPAAAGCWRLPRGSRLRYLQIQAAERADFEFLHIPAKPA